MNPAGCERTPGLRLFDTCLSLLTIHFLRVIYERNALIRLGFICPLLTIDAAAKMPRPSCLKVCPPPHTLPKCCFFFPGDSTPPASSLPSPTPSPICSISCSPSGCFKSTKKLRAGSAGSQGRQIWGTPSPWCHKCWGPSKASSQGPGELAPKVRRPAFEGRRRSPRS